MSGLWALENEIASSGVYPVCGVDEAGRGPLAGPVCAAAVILPQGYLPADLNDSKKLSEKQRDRLYDLIAENALSIGIAFASVEEIESINILNATFLAMNRAIEMLSPEPALALVDGNSVRGITRNSRAVIKGDELCASIAAASILAKVTRDRLMLEIRQEYPQYAFERHKGYGTKLHYELIEEHGPCPVHRLSYLRKRFGGRYG